MVAFLHTCLGLLAALVFAIAPSGALTAPENVAASDGSFPDRVVISWTQTVPRDNISYIIIYRADSATGTPVEIDKVSIYNSWYVDKTVTPGKTYTYWVQNFLDPDQYSPLSQGDSGFAQAGVCPTLPAPLLSEPANGAVVYYDIGGPPPMVWEGVPGAEEYQLQIIDLATNKTVVDEVLSDPGYYFYGNGKYKWHVRAMSPISDCPPGPWADFWTATIAPFPAPGIPVNVKATDGTVPDRVQVTWDNGPYTGSNPESWVIFRSETLTGPKKNVMESLSGPPVEDITAAPGKHYYYWVSSCNHEGACSDPSQPDEGWTGGQCLVIGNATILRPSSGQVIYYNPAGEDITLNWNSVEHVTWYQVQVADAVTGKLLVNTRAQFEYNLKAFTGKAKWRVRALHPAPGCLPSAWSAVSTFEMRPWLPPAVPIGVTASDAAYPDRIVVNWSAGAGGTPVNEYWIYRADSPTGAKTLLNKVYGADTTEYIDMGPGVTLLKVYSYWVRACNPWGGCSGYSQSNTGLAGVCPVVSRPTQIAPANGSTIYFDPTIGAEGGMAWKPVANAAAYRVELVMPGPVTRAYTTQYEQVDIYDLGEGKYSWRVRALNIPGCRGSAWTGYWTFKLHHFLAPGVPTRVVASNGLYVKQVRITWQNGPFTGWAAESYIIYRAETLTGKKVRISPPDWGQKSFVDRSAKVGKKYYYWVRACNHIYECSALSKPDVGWPAKAPAP